MVLTELLSFDCISELYQLAALLPYGIQLPKSLRFRRNTHMDIDRYHLQFRLGPSKISVFSARGFLGSGSRGWGGRGWNATNIYTGVH